VIDSNVALREKVNSLYTAGSTGLGPALAVAVGLASNVPRSEVIICTDGSPNVGLGSLPADPNFYEEIGTLAKQSSVSISIIGIEGASNAMSTLSRCSELSNGRVNLINPLELPRHMRHLLDTSSFAIEVGLSIYFPPGIKERGVQKENEEENILKVPIGNISPNSCYTVDFGVDFDQKELLEGKDRVPIQVQIDYKKLNGYVYKRVEQLWCNLSNDRESVEMSCDTATLGLHAIRQTAHIAYHNCKEAKYNLISNLRLLDRVLDGDKMEEYTCFVEAYEEIEPLIDQIVRSGIVAGNGANQLFKFKNNHKISFLSSERKTFYVEKLKKHSGEAKKMKDVHGG